MCTTHAVKVGLVPVARIRHAGAMHWVLLYMAIALEVLGTVSLRMSLGMGKPAWFGVAVVAYLACFALLSKTFDQISVGVAYAIWSGVGTVLIYVIGVMFFKEVITPLRLVFIALIIVGAVGLNLSTGVRA